jgi:hypothetical protein
MADDNGLLHELWDEAEDGAFTFCLAGPRGAGARATLSANAKLVWTVWAGSHFDAMTRYYDRQGWGQYTPGWTCDFEPYPAEWVQEQHQFLVSSSPQES